MQEFFIKDEIIDYNRQLENIICLDINFVIEGEDAYGTDKENYPLCNSCYNDYKINSNLYG